MTTILTKAGKGLFAKHLEQYSPQDPLYEFYTNEKGKKKRRKRAPPPGLSARDVKILNSIRRRAHYLDKGFSIFGFRFGWTFLIGIIPVVGDVADATMGYTLIIRKARKADIPSWLLRRMILNTAIGTGVGTVPLVGDVMLAMYKANSRNAALFEEFLRIRGEEYLRLQEGEEIVASDESDSDKEKKKRKKKKGVSKKDAEQVKPGAGIAPGEIIPRKPATSGPPLTSPLKPADATAGNTQESPGKKPFTFFRGKPKDGQVPPPGEKGRFIENIDEANK